MCGCRDTVDRTVLCDAHWLELMADLEKPAEPNENLRRAVKATIRQGLEQAAARRGKPS